MRHCVECSSRPFLVGFFPAEAAAWAAQKLTGLTLVHGDSIYLTALGAAKPGGTGSMRVNFAIPSQALNQVRRDGWFFYCAANQEQIDL